MICAPKCSGNRVRHLPVIERLITQTEVTGKIPNCRLLTGSHSKPRRKRSRRHWDRELFSGPDECGKARDVLPLRGISGAMHLWSSQQMFGMVSNSRSTSDVGESLESPASICDLKPADVA